ncbi:MAG: hypothetical protein QHJ73_03085, partial [Armatimonadota bacterium]|nr:hypothetical protein [Armatimonadota bacterium]
MEKNSLLSPQSYAAWAPRDEIAPRVRREEDAFVVTSNGSAGCYGGWEIAYPLPDTPFVEVEVTAAGRSLERGLDSIHAAVLWWGDPALPWWEPLLPTGTRDGATTYRGRARKPAGA